MLKMMMMKPVDGRWVSLYSQTNKKNSIKLSYSRWLFRIQENNSAINIFSNEYYDWTLFLSINFLIFGIICYFIFIKKTNKQVNALKNLASII